VLTTDLPSALDAILSVRRHAGIVHDGKVLTYACSCRCRQVLPLDFFIASPVQHMVPQLGVEMPHAGLQVLAECAHSIESRCPGTGVSPVGVERFEFYEQARKCFAVVQTLERRPYGNYILAKGVVGPDGKDLKP